MIHRLSKAVRAGLSVLAFLVLAAGPGRGGEQAPSAPDERPDFSGTWSLVRGLSGDIQSKIEEATGGGNLPGAGGIGGVGLLPGKDTRKDVERLELRQFLLDRIKVLDNLDVEQSRTEIKLIHGLEDVRIFYFDREHVRNDARGNKLRCRTHWQGAQLVIEEQGDNKIRIVDVLTLVPSRNQLIHGLRFEGGTLEKPLELNLAYDKVLIP